MLETQKIERCCLLSICLETSSFAQVMTYDMASLDFHVHVLHEFEKVKRAKISKKEIKSHESSCFTWSISLFFEYKKFVANAQQCFAFMPQANFPTHNLNFHLI